MRYGHVTNGVIDAGPSSLPKSWENYSGLNNMTNEQLRPLGWLPWIFVQVPVGYNQVLDGSTIEVRTVEILETQIVRDMTPSEIEARDQQEKDSNKEQAAARLTETDWVELGDVSDPTNPPYLTNKAEFTTYRAALRAIAVNPPVATPVWPERPEEVWAE